MTCQDFVELATSYLDDALAPSERQAFEEHLALCVGCERYLDQLRRTIDLLGAVPDVTLSDPALQRLLDAFAEWKTGGAPSAP
jgi:anti-sigma factor RsiW